MEMSEAWPDTFDEEYIHQFQPEPTHKNSLAAAEAEFKDILPWIISKMITKTIPISTRIVIRNVMSMEVNGNLDKNMIRISQWRESHCKTNTSITSKK